MYVYSADTWCDSCAEDIMRNLDSIPLEVPADFPVRPLLTDAQRAGAAVLATCGNCGYSWDDGIITSYTPTPSARCPFESFHRYDDDSDDYPQPADDDEATDGPSHCAGASKCLEAVDLYHYGLNEDDALYGAEARYVGAVLSDRLTGCGAAYVLELMKPYDLHYTRGIGAGATHVHTPTPYQAALYRLWEDVYADDLEAVRETKV